ncbi:MAG: hypothetical protein Ct9H90mV1_1110 [Prasinovirus sp.]|nr:MAG: hypothetical protein Ct9H90mV1_1110 [Prasinovirus sp.]
MNNNIKFINKANELKKRYKTRLTTHGLKIMLLNFIIHNYLKIILNLEIGIMC